MRTIKFWICENEKNQALNYPVKDFKNSLIEFKNEPKEIKITFSIFNFDENLNKKVIQILEESYKKAFCYFYWISIYKILQFIEVGILWQKIKKAKI